MDLRRGDGVSLERDAGAVCAPRHESCGQLRVRVRQRAHARTGRRNIRDAIVRRTILSD
jgi:hypothetical protein